MLHEFSPHCLANISHLPDLSHIARLHSKAALRAKNFHFESYHRRATCQQLPQPSTSNMSRQKLILAYVCRVVLPTMKLVAVVKYKTPLAVPHQVASTAFSHAADAWLNVMKRRHVCNRSRYGNDLGLCWFVVAFRQSTSIVFPFSLRM